MKKPDQVTVDWEDLDHVLGLVGADPVLSHLMGADEAIQRLGDALSEGAQRRTMKDYLERHAPRTAFESYALQHGAALAGAVTT